MNNKVELPDFNVRVLKTPEDVSNLAVEFGGAQTFPVPNITASSPVQILQRRPTRYKSVITVQSLGGAQVTLNPGNPAAGADFVYTNNSGSPQTLVSALAVFTASAVVANRFPSYQIRDASSHVIAADTDTSAVVATNVVNIRAYQGATHQNSPSGSVVLVLPQNVVIPPGGTFTFTGEADPGDQWSSVILTFAANSGGSGAASSLVFAHRQDYLANPANPIGFTVSTAPYTFQWESQQPCYAVAIGGGPVNVSVLDQAQAASESTAEEERQVFDLSEIDEMEGSRYAGSDAGNQY